jgi:hypothetical protein
MIEFNALFVAVSGVHQKWDPENAKVGERKGFCL